MALAAIDWTALPYKHLLPIAHTLAEGHCMLRYGRGLATHFDMFDTEI
jgi:hypothetical protein